ncbi:YbfB/YjiJ family MFS transporter [Roseomonas hellenica]|uniref:YbfB/YjiJ family MFS transporter n=1 Tax=Plastoroseomonas hellenica TaxID=2687306 RepID=A0ABS5EWK9_9PROT|nr:YbfB/YjiJ family MFS transporter [Plastoroseomonas hellenica]MBR0664683.1 YbfB/YjiJ family MFS transporter [Plastoroseomonas hellenica]
MPRKQGDRYLPSALAGAAATAAGNGLARFAYVPLFPAMIGAGWVDGGQAGALGAVALLGSLLGTLAGRHSVERNDVPKLLNFGMLLLVLSLIACAWNAGFWWLMVWRCLAGVGGGLLMAIAGPATLAVVPPCRKGVAGGIVVAGVGFGIVGGALSVPALLHGGVAAAWSGLAALVALLWMLAHRHWPRAQLNRPPSGTPTHGNLLVVTYAVHSAGMVPPMVYLADLAVRHHHMGIGAGAMIWLVFGLAGVAGGVLAGQLADRISSRVTLQVLLGTQVLALALCIQPSTILIVPAAGLAGFAAVGVSTVTLTLAQEIAREHAVTLWIRCSASFSVTQAIVGFLLAAAFVATAESHLVVFSAGLGLSVLAFAAARRL